MKDFLDDKNLVIIAALILGICAIFNSSMTPEASKIVENILIGLFGLAVGKTLK